MTVSSSTATTIHPVAVLLELFKRQDWQSIRTLIEVSSPDCFRNMARSVSSYAEHRLKGMTLLHVMVRGNPPSDILCYLIKLCPEMASVKDDLGRCPLHIAACSEASPLHLKLIARAYPAACDAQDKDGRTPLHFLCDTSATLFAEEVMPSTPQHKKELKHEAIVALLSESPNAAAIEDENEMSPLEHAIMCDAKMATVKLLQHSASESLRSRARPVSSDLVTNKRRRVSILLEDTPIALR